MNPHDMNLSDIQRDRESRTWWKIAMVIAIIGGVALLTYLMIAHPFG
jgi:hypothetical protein